MTLTRIQGRPTVIATALRLTAPSSRMVLSAEKKRLGLESLYTVVDKNVAVHL